MKIICSYHPHDPVSDDVIPYHGAHRGIRSLLLLSKISPPTLETDAVTIDILNNHVRNKGCSCRSEMISVLSVIYLPLSISYRSFSLPYKIRSQKNIHVFHFNIVTLSRVITCRFYLSVSRSRC